MADVVYCGQCCYVAMLRAVLELSQHIPFVVIVLLVHGLQIHA